MINSNFYYGSIRSKSKIMKFGMKNWQLCEKKSVFQTLSTSQIEKPVEVRKHYIRFRYEVPRNGKYGHEKLQFCVFWLHSRQLKRTWTWKPSRLRRCSLTKNQAALSRPCWKLLSQFWYKTFKKTTNHIFFRRLDSSFWRQFLENITHVECEIETHPKMLILEKHLA